MNIVLNDVVFLYKFENNYTLINAIEILVDVFLELEKNRKKYQILLDRDVSTLELMNGYNMPKMFNDKLIRADHRRMILKVFSHVKIVDSTKSKAVVLNDGEQSNLIGYADENGLILLSIITNEKFNTPLLVGKKGNNDVVIKNVGTKSHIYTHSEEFNIRIYEMNPKHKIGYNWGSPMDLNDDVAQKVLDKAIVYNDDSKCLINYYNGKYYVFRRHINNCYHGYINDFVPENIKRKLSEIRNEI